MKDIDWTYDPAFMSAVERLAREAATVREAVMEAVQLGVDWAERKPSA